jgi:hypothetical protein
MTGAQIERAKAKDRMARQARLSREDYQAWKGLLRELHLGRQSIKRAMGFAFDKIESAVEVPIYSSMYVLSVCLVFVFVFLCASVVP